MHKLSKLELECYEQLSKLQKNKEIEKTEDSHQYLYNITHDLNKNINIDNLIKDHVWLDVNGNAHLIEKMSTQHIKRCIQLLESDMKFPKFGKGRFHTENKLLYLRIFQEELKERSIII